MWIFQTQYIGLPTSMYIVGSCSGLYSLQQCLYVHVLYFYLEFCRRKTSSFALFKCILWSNELIFPRIPTISTWSDRYNFDKHDTRINACNEGIVELGSFAEITYLICVKAANKSNTAYISQRTWNISAKS